MTWDQWLTEIIQQGIQNNQKIGYIDTNGDYHPEVSFNPDKSSFNITNGIPSEKLICDFEYEDIGIYNKEKFIVRCVNEEKEYITVEFENMSILSIPWKHESLPYLGKGKMTTIKFNKIELTNDNTIHRNSE